jgi:hypothetical protein
MQLRANTTSSGVKDQLQNIKDLLEIAKVGEFKNCVKVSKDIFTAKFDHDIRDLISLFPEDHCDSHG